MRTGNNIRLRTDGRFEARYIKGRDLQGHAIYGYCYGKTSEEAARKRERAMRELTSVREMNLLILGGGESRPGGPGAGGEPAGFSKDRVFGR